MFLLEVIAATAIIIVGIVKERDGEEFIRVIGTASVISCTGYVLTAAHVLMDPFESGYGARRLGDGLQYDEALHLVFFCQLVLRPVTVVSFFARLKSSGSGGNGGKALYFMSRHVLSLRLMLQSARYRSCPMEPHINH